MQRFEDEQSPVPDITDEEMRRTVIMVRRELTEIRNALIGNNMGTLGVIPRLDNVEKQSSNNARILTALSGCMAVLTLALIFLKDLRDIFSK